MPRFGGTWGGWWVPGPGHGNVCCLSAPSWVTQRVEGTPAYPPHPQPHPTGLLPEVAVAEEAPALAPEVPPEEEMEMEPEPLLPPETAPPPPAPPGGFGDALEFGEGVCVHLW